MTNFEHGYSTGKMYAATPYWWLGFFYGQWAGSWKKFNEALDTGRSALL